MTASAVSSSCRRGAFVVLAAISCLVSGVCFAAEKSNAKQHTAKALLRVSPLATTPIGAAEPEEFDRDGFEIYKRTQRALMTSPFVLRAALGDPEASQLQSVKDAQSKGDPVAWLAQRVSVDFPGDAEVMQVSVGGNDPDEAALLTNAVVGAYLAEVVDAERDLKRQRYADLDRICVETEAAIREKRKDLMRLSETVGIAAAEAKRNLALSALPVAQQDEADARRQLRRLKVDLAGQKAILDNAAAFDKLDEEGKAEKLAVVQTEVKRLEASIAAAAEEQRGLRADVEKLRGEIRAPAPASTDVEMLHAEIANLNKALSLIAEERGKMKVEMRAAPRVTLLQRAELPARAAAGD